MYPQKQWTKLQASVQTKEAPSLLNSCDRFFVLAGYLHPPPQLPDSLKQKDMGEHHGENLNHARKIGKFDRCWILDRESSHDIKVLVLELRQNSE